MSKTDVAFFKNRSFRMDTIYKKLSATFKKVAESPDFQKALANLEVTYEYKDGSQLEKDVRVEYEFYKDFMSKTGAIKK